jgi:hypothetical protein
MGWGADLFFDRTDANARFASVYIEPLEDALIHMNFLFVDLYSQLCLPHDQNLRMNLVMDFFRRHNLYCCEFEDQYVCG